MEINFDAIGLEIPNEKAFNNLAEDAEKRGEASRLARKSGVLHGRCWRLGEGLEVWTVLYESAAGEVVQAGCRPGFRSRFQQRINPWIMTEFDEEGEALIHGYIEDTDTEVLFELQNLTEVGTKNFEETTLTVGLCGLAYEVEILKKSAKNIWKPLGASPTKKENDWSLCGEIISFKALSNPFSGNDLFWVHLGLTEFDLEILVSRRALKGKELAVGCFLRADVWLQGHVLSKSTRRSSYEGVDYSVPTIDFWKKFKKLN
ncbi:MAG: hypothetical protein ACR2L1_02890 [Pyrinomonadaceae bacterium]